MKSPWVGVALVAAVASFAGAAVVELLRGPSSRPPTAAAAAGEAKRRAPAAREAADAGLPAPVGPVETAPDHERIDELEVRVAALERALSGRRAAAETSGAAATSPPEDRGELRALVLGWVEEEREARRRVAEREGEDAQRKTLEFEARFQAHMLAEEHDLEPWQEERFADLFLETRERGAELDASIDPTVDDPADVEARWEEFDAWVDRREREVTLEVAPALYDELYGEG